MQAWMNKLIAILKIFHQRNPKQFWGKSALSLPPNFLPTMATGLYSMLYLH